MVDPQACIDGVWQQALRLRRGFRDWQDETQTDLEWQTLKQARAESWSKRRSYEDCSNGRDELHADQDVWSRKEARGNTRPGIYRMVISLQGPQT